MTDSYFTIGRKTLSEIKISKSKFIGQAIPFVSQSEIPEIIKSVKKEYYDAAHHPYAFRAGVSQNNFRMSDDGEPSGSAGKPILDAIGKFDLTDVIVIIARYFGGVKLGVGGLRRAFFETADHCLHEAVKIEKLITEIVNLEFDYKYMNVVMNFIETEKIKLLQNSSDE
nr:YigZ family protein [Ignavibacteria bacterium]